MAWQATVVAIMLLCIIAEVNGDLYLHTARGSNNRLNEETQDRKTNNRIFDSQNNNKGGYNVGDRTTQKSRGSETRQYQSTYFASATTGTGATGATWYPIEWTSQHGCGENKPGSTNKLNCNMVLQFMCQTDTGTSSRDYDRIRDGTTTNRIDYKKAPSRGPSSETKRTFDKRKARAAKTNRGMHEPIMNYDRCTVRERNKGLFTADQNLKSKTAKSTRQNPNGNRNGYECPEERDYYPYWHPTDWKDIAVFTEDKSLCTKFETESFNVKPKHECRERFASGEVSHYSTINNEAKCNAKSGATWTEVHNYLEKFPEHQTEGPCIAAGLKWGDLLYGTKKECFSPLEKPICDVADYTRVNHLGNSKDLKPAKYMWKLPKFTKPQKCVFRTRYNISTDDYDPYNTFADKNDKDEVIENNPKVDVGLDGNQKLQLALNTAQTGRTFQDRSHMFYVKPRPADFGTKQIKVLTVRGKRGNIVQTFPAVEYDFVPNDLKVSTKDYVHIQWTGSNSHKNRGGGDGQPGDDGEGKGGTDRSNIMSMLDRDRNFFQPLEHRDNMVNNMRGIWSEKKDVNAGGMSSMDIGVMMSTAGQFKSVADVQRKNAGGWQNQLNNAPPSFSMMVQFKAPKKHVYGCTRNNNFSNRSQKGSIEVTA